MIHEEQKLNRYIIPPDLPLKGRDKEIQDALNQYHHFLMKYINAFDESFIDFKSYDLRYFISMYEPDKVMRGRIRKALYHKNEVKHHMYNLLFKSKTVFQTFSRTEIEHEVMIVFLECWNQHNPDIAPFEKFLYKVFRYKMKRHIDRLRSMSAIVDERAAKEEIEELSEEDVLQTNFHQEEDLELHNQKWLKGEICSEPFKKLNYHERFILQKYYIEKIRDKEISQEIPFHPKSIARMRLRAVRKIEKEIVLNA